MAENKGPKLVIPVSTLRYFRGTLVLFLVTLVLILGLGLKAIRFSTVGGTEKGVLLNHISGDVEILQAGTHIYNGITKSFVAIDVTLQTEEMVQERGRGKVTSRDDLKVKTIDGSDVELDLTVQYQLLTSAEDIRKVVSDSGTGDAYKNKWIRDYARSICRNTFGELTTEQFYDSAMRGEKARKATDILNERLNPFAIHIVTIIPEEFRFYEEYEEKIKLKKLADQSVEAETSKARAARESMARMRVEATKAKDVFVEAYTGSMREIIVTAEAEAQKARENAEAYAIKTRVNAEAQKYQMEKEASAILATKKAEAEGLAQMANALKGDGGVNIVKMEYAKKLRDMRISGQPFTIRGVTERFEHHEDQVSRPTPRTQTRTSKSGTRASAGQEDNR